MPRFHLPCHRRTRYRRKHSRTRMNLLFLLLLTTILLLTPLYLIYKPPHALINYFARRWPDILWHVETTKKIVALTIDDAPSEYTEEIRGVLGANNATATFFVIGSQVAGRERDLEGLVREGHELGNHAMRDEASRGLSDEELEGQIGEVEGMIERAYGAGGVRGGYGGRYFRPGSGFFSRRMRDLVRRMGYRLVLGSVYPHDPQIGYAGVNARHVLSMVRPGAIVICHDRRGWTAAMLRKVLPELRRRGYRVVTVSELLREVKS